MRTKKIRTEWGIEPRTCRCQNSASKKPLLASCSTTRPQLPDAMLKLRRHSDRGHDCLCGTMHTSGRSSTQHCALVMPTHRAPNLLLRHAIHLVNCACFTCGATPSQRRTVLAPACCLLWSAPPWPARAQLPLVLYCKDFSSSCNLIVSYRDYTLRSYTLQRKRRPGRRCDGVRVCPLDWCGGSEVLSRSQPLATTSGHVDCQQLEPRVRMGVSEA